MAGTQLNTRTAKLMQQEFANNYGTNRAVIWDLYKSNDKNLLRAKILQLIPDCVIDEEDIYKIYRNRQLSNERREEEVSKLTEKTETDNNKKSEIRERLLESIWSQRKYSNGDLLMSIIFILHVQIIEDKPNGYALHETNYEIHPLFRVRRCTRSYNPEKCCMIFVDENGRVYQDWFSYVTENTLPEGIIVVPAKGIYDFDTSDIVKLDYFITPESTIEKKVIGYVDKYTRIIGLGVAAVPIAALAIPVAAPILAASATVAVGTGFWSVLRSFFNLSDRERHEESISFSDREARASWLGVAGGAIGLWASGATRDLIRNANAGNQINKFTHFAVKGMNIASLTVNGFGMTNGLYDVILKRKDEEISDNLVLQLNAPLALFTHSLYNFQYVFSIVKSTKSDGMLLSDFRKTLSNTQRNMYRKMVDDTIRIRGPTQGYIEVVRSIGSIPDITAHFSGNTNRLLGNQQNPVDPKFIEITVKFLLENCNILNESDLRKCIIKISENLIEAAVTELIKIARDFTNGFFKENESRIGIYIPFEKILWETFDIAGSLAVKEGITPVWLIATSRPIVRYLINWIQNIINRDTNKKKKLCDICGGYYSITKV